MIDHNCHLWLLKIYNPEKVARSYGNYYVFGDGYSIFFMHMYIVLYDIYCGMNWLHNCQLQDLKSTLFIVI